MALLAVEIVSNIYLICCILAFTYIAFRVITLFYWQRLRFPILKSLKILTQIGIYSSIICCIIDTVHMFWSTTDSVAPEDNYFDTIVMIADAFQCIALTMLYLIIIIRLKDIFANTTYEISSPIIITLIIFIIISFCVQINYMFWVQNNNYSYQRISIFIVLFFDFCVNITIIILVCYKLHILVRDTHETMRRNTELIVNDNNDVSDIRKSILFDSIQHNLLNIMTKLSVLTAFQVIILHTYGIYIFIADSIPDSTSHQTIRDLLFVILYPYRNTILILMSASIFLGFKENDKGYYVWCKFCDLCCNRCCIKVAEQNIRAQESVSYLPPTVVKL